MPDLAGAGRVAIPEVEPQRAVGLEDPTNLTEDGDDVLDVHGGRRL